MARYIPGTFLYKSSLYRVRIGSSVNLAFLIIGCPSLRAAGYGSPWYPINTIV